jgi:hypothetical protein
LISEVKEFNDLRGWAQYHSPKNLADKLGIDPVEASFRKIRINAEKYPAASSHSDLLKNEGHCFK